LQNSNTLLQDKLGAEEIHISHVLSQLNDEHDAQNSTRIILKHVVNKTGLHLIRYIFKLVGIEGVSHFSSLK
jgi:hypothetical protein